MKTLKIIALLILIFTFTGVTSSANTFYGYSIPVTISVNGNIIETENSGILINSATYAPIRFVANALNIYDISWNEKEKSATISFEGKTLSLYANKDYAQLNGSSIPVSNTVIVRNGNSCPFKIYSRNI